MSENEQLSGPGVSRETSEPEIGAPTKPSSRDHLKSAPQLLRGEEPQRNEGASVSDESERYGARGDEVTPEQQMLYDIIDRSMTKTQKRSDGEGPEDPAPPQEEPEGEQQDSPPPPQKNKPSSFYVYLAVLFGAAFLMLLLAYFVQQRNNDAVRYDLELLTASRQELLEQIKGLEKERDQLQEDLKGQKEQTTDAEEAQDWLGKKLEESQKDLLRMTSWYDNAHTLDRLEQFVRDRDYLMAGTVVVESDVMFNRNTSVYTSVDTWLYLTPVNEKRYLDLKEQLFQKSGFMTLTQEGDGSGYTPGMPTFEKDAFQQEELDTAQALWYIIRNYAIAPDFAAIRLQDCYERLTQNRGLFRPSTMELLEEIKEDLIAQELVTEEDGELISNVSFAVQEDGFEPLVDPVDPTKIPLGK